MSIIALAYGIQCSACGAFLGQGSAIPENTAEYSWAAAQYPSWVDAAEAAEAAGWTRKATCSCSKCGIALCGPCRGDHA